MSDVKAGQAYIEITANNDNLKKKLSDTSGEIQRLAGELARRENDFKVELTAKTEQFKAGLNAAKKEIKETTQTAQAAEKQLRLKLQANTKEYESKLKSARSELEKLKEQHKKTTQSTKQIPSSGGGTKSAGAGIQGLKIAADAAKFAIQKLGQAFDAASKYVKEAVAEYATFGDQMNKMSSRTGMSSKFLSELKYISEMNGAGIEKVEAGVKGLQTVLASADADKKLKSIGLSLDELNTVNAEEKFESVLRALSAIDDPTRRAGLAMQLMGEAARDLMPTIDAGVDSFDSMRAKAAELGIVLSDEAAAGGAALTDALSDMQSAGKGLKLSIGQIFADEFKSGAEYCKRVLIEVRKWIEDNKEAIMSWVRAFGDIGKNIYDYIVVPLGKLAGLDFSGVRSLSRELNEQVESTRRLHEQDSARFKIVEQLAAKESLTNEELGRASAIVSDLEKKYGAIGVAIDTNTGKINIQADAQKKLGEAMKAKQIADLQYAIAGQKEAADKSKEDWEKASKKRQAAQGAWVGFRNSLNPNSWKDYDTVVEEEKRAKARMNADRRQQKAMEDYLKSLQATSGEKVVEDAASKHEEKRKQGQQSTKTEPTASEKKEDKYASDHAAISSLGDEITALIEQIAEKKLKGEDTAQFEKQKQEKEIVKARQEFDLAAKERTDAKAALAAVPETATDKEKDTLKKKVEQANQKWQQAAERLGQLAEGVDREAKQAAEKAKREADAEAKKGEKKKDKGPRKVDDYDEKIAKKQWDIAEAKQKGKGTEKLENELEQLQLKQAIAKYRAAEEAQKAAKAELDAARKAGDTEAEDAAAGKLSSANSDMSSAASSVSAFYDKRARDDDNIANTQKKQQERMTKELEDGKDAITVKTGSNGSMSAWGINALFGTDYQQQIAANTRTQIQTLKNIEKHLKNNTTKYA